MPSKKLKKPFLYKPHITAIVMLGILLIVSLVFKNRLLSKSEIDLVSSSNSEPTNCKSNLERLEAGKICNQDSYSQYKYRCVGGADKTYGDGTSCLSFSLALQKIQSICGTNCVVSSSPSPIASKTPYPSPSIAPLPSGCQYTNVQCVKAPCNPAIVCSVPSVYPSPSLMPSPTPVATAISAKVSSTPSPSLAPRGVDNSVARRQQVCTKVLGISWLKWCHY